ncbi:hypothetical protein HDK77DRAFT_443071 [Phyllosticta capitalensis]|uniref:uncharacterized protein n=1 Tax=Phyllosticta capitalensis TaxID=121624 RepID=UPI00312FE7F1
MLCYTSTLGTYLGGWVSLGWLAACCRNRQRLVHADATRHSAAAREAGDGGGLMAVKNDEGSMWFVPYGARVRRDGVTFWTHVRMWMASMCFCRHRPLRHLSHLLLWPQICCSMVYLLLFTYK